MVCVRCPAGTPKLFPPVNTTSKVTSWASVVRALTLNCAAVPSVTCPPGGQRLDFHVPVVVVPDDHALRRTAFRAKAALADDPGGEYAVLLGIAVVYDSKLGRVAGVAVSLYSAIKTGDHPF